MTGLGGTAPLPDLVWPQVRRGPANGAFLPDGPSLSSEPSVEWSVAPTNASDAERYTPEFSAPVAADDRVYVANRLRFGTNVAAPDTQYLRAYDLAAGEQVWEFDVGTRSDPAPRDLPTAPAVHGDAVLFGIGRTVRAVSATGGDARWSRSLGEQVHAVVPTPERIYARAHRSVVALAAGGTVEWETRVPEYPATMAVGDSLVYVSVSRRVLALDPATGEVRWTESLPPVDDGYGIRRLVAIEGGVLAVQNSGDCYGLRNDGERVWRATRLVRDLASDGTTAYLTEGDALTALDVATGDRRWRRSCEDVDGCGRVAEIGTPIVTGDALLVPVGRALVAVDARDGSVRWRFDAPARFVSLALGDDAVLGVGDEGRPLVAMTPG